MAIGTALFLIAITWFAIAYAGFRKLLLVYADIAAVLLIAAMTIVTATNKTPIG
jgi:hypothetical protein